MLFVKNLESYKDYSLHKLFVDKTVSTLKHDFNIQTQNMEFIKNINFNTIELYDITFLSILYYESKENVIFSFEKSLAKAVLDNFPFIEYTPDILEKMLYESVSEFLNIIIGHSLKELNSSFQISFSTPIAANENDSIFCLKTSKTSKFLLKTKYGNMYIIFSKEIKE